jgi:PKD repeat protein
MSNHTHLLTSTGRRLASLGLAAASSAIFLLAAGTASADTFTVTAGDASSLQSALGQAAAHANSGGPDVVSVPAGTYTGNFNYAGDAVDIEGAGPAATKLTAASTATFRLNAPASTVRGLSLENTQPGIVGYALALDKGGTVRDVELVATGNNVYGLKSSGNTAVTGARIVVGSADTGLVQASTGTMTISQTTIEGSGGSSSVGVAADAPGAIVQASRLRSRGVPRPLRAVFGGSLSVRDSLLVLPASVPATALEVGDNNNPTNFTSTLAAERVTVVGDPASSQTGALVFSNSAGDDFEISIHDSLLVGVKKPLQCFSSAGTGSATADWSSLPGADSSGGAGCTVARTNPVAGTAIFVDPAGGDYHQRYDSPLIDAGDPAPLTALDDLDGLPRPLGRVDLGTYEYQRRSPLVSVSATPAGATTGQDVTFVATASDPDPGDSPLAYSWSFDDGGTATGASATHAFATAGPHTATVTVIDPTGQSTSAASTVTVIDPTGQSTSAASTVTLTAPAGSAPVPDRTRPTITLRVKSRLSLTRALRRGIPATIGCSEGCTYKATVRLDPRTARRLHIARRVTLGKRTTSLTAAGRRTIRIKVARRARTALRNLASVKLLVRATATDPAGNTSPARARKTMLRP